MKRRRSSACLGFGRYSAVNYGSGAILKRWEGGVFCHQLTERIVADAALDGNLAAWLFRHHRPPCRLLIGLHLCWRVFRGANSCAGIPPLHTGGMSDAISSPAAIEELQRARRPVPPAEIQEYRREGFLMLRGLFSAETAEILRREVLHIMSVIGLGQTKLRQTPQYLAESALAAYVKSELLREVASSLMGRPAHLYLPFTAVKSGGGGGRFHFHQDGNYTRYVAGHGINLWAALSPMSQATGALQILPRSHRQGERPSENAGDGDAHRKVVGEPEDFLLLDMAPGDVVAFDRWTVHGSGPNQTDEHRLAYAVQFHSDDAVAEINGERQLLVEKPRWTDIWGVREITPDNAGKRDGH